MQFKECPNCHKSYLKELGFGKGKRKCLHCEGKPSAALPLDGSQPGPDK